MSLVVLKQTGKGHGRKESPITERVSGMALQQKSSFSYLPYSENTGKIIFFTLKLSRIYIFFTQTEIIMSSAVVMFTPSSRGWPLEQVTHFPPTRKRDLNSYFAILLQGGALPLESNKQQSTAAQEAPNELLSTHFHSEFSEECLNNEAAKCNSAEDVRPKARRSRRSLLKDSGEAMWMFGGRRHHL